MLKNIFQQLKGDIIQSVRDYYDAEHANHTYLQNGDIAVYEPDTGLMHDYFTDVDAFRRAYVNYKIFALMQ